MKYEYKQIVTYIEYISARANEEARESWRLTQTLKQATSPGIPPDLAKHILIFERPQTNRG